MILDAQGGNITMACQGYKDDINKLIQSVDKELIDFSVKREKGTPPTQASSEFLINKHQGDWAEKTLLNAINNTSTNYIAVKYGLDLDLVAGDPGFKEFYEKYQDQLDNIGKKPDLLIFKKDDYKSEWGLNISEFPEEILDEIVPKALCGIEVRSSSFMYEIYNKFSIDKNVSIRNETLKIVDIIKKTYMPLIEKKRPKLIKFLNEASFDNLHLLEFKYVTMTGNDNIISLDKYLCQIRENLKELKKRDFLSITPKVEDIKVVYNWIQKYGIPHYYCQVFFDSAFGISFEEILRLISDKSKQNVDYFIEGDVKNQNKITIKINTRKCIKIMEDIQIPETKSSYKKLGLKGRLMFFVDFEPSKGKILPNEIYDLLGFKL